MRALVLNARSGPDSPEQRDAFKNYCASRPLSVRFVNEAAFVDLQGAGVVAQAAEGSKGKRENAIITTAEPESVHHIQLTDALSNERIWHDRWTPRARYPGGVVRYVPHANAAIQDGPDGPWKTNPGAKAWRAGIRQLAAHIRTDIANGLHVQVGGDLNWHGTHPWQDSPADIFSSLGMHFVNRELMWFAWTPAWLPANTLFGSPVRELANPPGSDHIALSVRLRRK